MTEEQLRKSNAELERKFMEAGELVAALELIMVHLEEYDAPLTLREKNALNGIVNAIDNLVGLEPRKQAGV